MFGLLFDLTQFSISIVYPLHQSYKTIQTNDTHAIIQWLIYWIVLAMLINIQNFFNPILRFIPFIGLIKIYFLVWLVFPVLDKKDYKFGITKTKSGITNDKIGKLNGAIIVWEFYLIPFLSNFDNKLTNFVNLNFTNFKKLSINLFNLIIDTWLPGHKNLKIFGTYEEEPEKEDSFMGSVYVIFKETKFLGIPSESDPNVKAADKDSNFIMGNNKHITLLKSLLSLMSFKNINSVSHESSLDLSSTQRIISSTEEYDVVDVSELPDSGSSDSEGSLTSNGWFNWRSKSPSNVPGPSINDSESATTSGSTQHQI